MEIQLLERLRQGLLVTRSSLSAWLRTTTPDKKSILLGPASERAVQNRLEAVDHALAKAGSGSLGKCEVCHDDVEPEILEVDYSCCVCIDHLSDKERRQLEYELELAQNIQSCRSSRRRYRAWRLPPTVDPVNSSAAITLILSGLKTDRMV